MTRRSALALGATAGITATLGAPPSALAAAAAGLGAEGPSYLRRSTYADLVGETFAVGRHVLTLVGVGDVRGADFDRRLRGHEDAFELEFIGVADALGSDIHALKHALLGPFPLFLGPVGAVRGLEQSYGATVDRTIRVGRAPRPPVPSEPATAAPAPAGGDAGDAPAAAASEPSERDLAIIAARAEAQRAQSEQRRRAARRALRKLRRTHDDRIRFKRKRRARMKRARTGWLTRHGR